MGQLERLVPDVAEIFMRAWRQLICAYMVMALTHDSSTRGGNSGSPLLDVRTGQVLGLHFDGDYLKQNYAVPSDELVRMTTVLFSPLPAQAC